MDVLLKVKERILEVTETVDLYDSVDLDLPSSSEWGDSEWRGLTLWGLHHQLILIPFPDDLKVRVIKSDNPRLLKGKLCVVESIVKTHLVDSRRYALLQRVVRKAHTFLRGKILGKVFVPPSQYVQLRSMLSEAMVEPCPFVFGPLSPECQEYFKDLEYMHTNLTPSEDVEGQEDLFVFRVEVT